MIRDPKKKRYRPTCAEVDLSAIEYNFRQVKRIVKNKAKVLVALKADAYGHGAVALAKRLISCRVDYFGVATIEETIELRENRIKVPALLLGVTQAKNADVLIKYNIIPTIADLDSALSLNKKLKIINKKIKVHIKIDTGMGRLGVWHKEAVSFVKRVSQLKQLIIKIVNHYAMLIQMILLHTELMLLTQVNVNLIMLLFQIYYRMV